MVKPLGVYGRKVEIVRLLRSLDAVDEDMCVNFPLFSSYADQTLSAHLLLIPTELGGSGPALSSGLYILAAGQVDPNQDHHYVIYWPEDSTWNDSAAASICQNRVTFMRWVLVDACVDGHIFLVAHIPIIQISYENVRSSGCAVIGGALRFLKMERRGWRYGICGVMPRFSGNPFIRLRIVELNV
jgi:hypothetical protein